MVMVAEEKKSGNSRHFEPLRAELIDTFGDNKECTPAPKAVYSSRRGPAGKMGVSAEEANDDDNDTNQASNSEHEEEPKKKKCRFPL